MHSSTSKSIRFPTSKTSVHYLPFTNELPLEHISLNMCGSCGKSISVLCEMPATELFLMISPPSPHNIGTI